MEVKFHLGRACNLRCSYCRVDKINEPTENYLPILDEIMEDLMSRNIRVTKLLLTGGEPTLYHDQVMYILNKYNDYCDKITLVSNGTSVGKMIEYSKFDHVQLSMSWDGHQNDRGFDSYESLKKLKDMGIKCSVCYVMSNANFGRLYEDMEELSKINPELPNSLELLVMVAKRSDYKYDYDVIRDQLTKVYDKWPKIPIFQSNKTKRCPHVHSEDTLIEIRYGEVYRGCVNYAYDAEMNKSFRLNCNDPLYNKCLACDNEFCHTCSNRLLQTVYDGCDVYADDVNNKYWESIPRCKIYRIIKDIVTAKRRTNFFLSKLRNVDRIELIISDSCNMACTYCVENGHKGNSDMTTEVIDRVVKYMAEVRDDGGKVPGIMLFGGEPFLARNVDVLNHFLDKLKEYNLDPDIQAFTNGYDFSYDIRKFIIRLNAQFRLASIQVSLDSIQKVNDLRRISRTGEGTFKNVLENVVWLSSIIGWKKLVLNSVLDYDHISAMPLWVKWVDNNLTRPGIIRACDIKLDQVRDKPISYLQQNELRDAYRAVTEMFINGDILRSSLESAFGIAHVKCDSTRNLGDPGCGMAESFIAVRPNGEIVPCHSVMRAPRMVMGEFTDKGVVASEDVYFVYDTFACTGQFRCDGVECYTCSVFDTCAKCKGVEYLKHGNPRNLNPIKCQVNKLRVDVLGEYGITLDFFRQLTEEEIESFKNDLKELQIYYNEEKDNMSEEERKEIEKNIIEICEVLKR